MRVCVSACVAGRINQCELSPCVGMQDEPIGEVQDAICVHMLSSTPCFKLDTSAESNGTVRTLTLYPMQSVDTRVASLSVFIVRSCRCSKCDR